MFQSLTYNHLTQIAGIAAAAAAATLLPAGQAHAQEAWVGVLDHSVTMPTSWNPCERGIDFQLGLRAAPQDKLAFLLKPAPYVFASINSGGGASFVAAGLSWKIGKGPLYVRPGIGMAIHSGPAHRRLASGRRVQLGSRVVFEPEIALGYRLSPRVAVEASWTHLSHARLFNHRQNPGLDMLGVRVTFKL